MIARKFRLSVFFVLTVYLLAYFLLPYSLTYAQEIPVEQTTIVTGDALANSITETTVNSNEETISTDTNVVQENQANIEVVNEAEAVSGQNSVQEVANSEIDTGNSTSFTENTNIVNENIIEASTAAVTEEKPVESFIIQNNEATLETTSQSESISGQNKTVENENSAETTTGDAIAQVEEVNLVNSNLVNSLFKFFSYSSTENLDQNLDLNALWKAWEKEQIEASNNTTQITAVNIADIDLSAKAEAISGQNISTTGGTNNNITTGDAYALINMFNLVNLNLIDSKLLIGTINLYGDVKGNIILPSPERFSELVSKNNTSYIQITSQNTASIETNATALSITGANTQINQTTQTITTGEAISESNTTNLVNLNLIDTSWYQLFVYELGLWQGKTFENKIPQEASTENQIVNAKNDVSIKASAIATAISGQNTTSGGENSTIETGDAKAMANIFNLLNTNLINSRMFIPMISLFGDWDGNLVFAYPILEVNITADKSEAQVGDIVNYVITYKNTGYEESRNTQVEVIIPPDLEVSSASGGKLIFLLGTVPANESGTLTFSGKIVNILSHDKNKFSLIGQAFAEDSQFVTTIANITTSDSQSDTSHNSSSNSVQIVNLKARDYEMQNTSTETASTNFGTPQLEISVSDSDGEFVYPNDSINYTVEIFNKGSGLVKEVIVYQYLTDGQSPLSLQTFFIGEISPGLSRKLTYTLQVPEAAPENQYLNIFYAMGKSEKDEEIKSNEFVTNFLVKLKQLGLIPPVLAAEKKKAQVLGAQTTKTEACVQEKKYPWFILILLLVLLYAIERRKRRQLERKFGRRNVSKLPKDMLK